MQHLSALFHQVVGFILPVAERLGAPVLTTCKCKGAIPEDHPLRAGCIIGGVIEKNLVNEADLIITVGLDAVELQPKPWPYKIPVLSLLWPLKECRQISENTAVWLEWLLSISSRKSWMPLLASTTRSWNPEATRP